MRHRKDDFAYATHGARSAIEALNHLNERPATLLASTCLDFGCGTGRISRVLASSFKTVIAWDPSPVCMEAARRECPSIAIRNLVFVDKLDGVAVDYCVSVNVIEHLIDSEATVALETMHAITRRSVVVWYHQRQRHLRYLNDAVPPRGKIGIAIIPGGYRP